MASPEYTETLQTLDRLTKQINRMEGDFRSIIIMVVLDLRREILANSPVRTGWYRANNRVVFGSNIPEDTVGDPKTITPQQLAEYMGGVPAIPTGPIRLATLFNNVPYAKALEDGHSQQAPFGIYQISADFVEAKLQFQIDQKGYGK